MNVVPIATGLTLPPNKVMRSHGVHVSGLIRGLAVEMGFLKPEWVEELSLVEVGSSDDWWERLDPVAKVRISVGLAWENYYIPLLPHVVNHPGEMCVDGVFMTHDGESLDVIITERGEHRNILAVHEIKATYKSLRTLGDLTSQWMYLAQCKAYCKGLETTRAYLHVLLLCGDYSYPIGPQLRVWQIDFTQQEIDENWSLLMDYKRERLGE